jgi:transposase
MNQNEKERLQARLKWVTLYEDIKDAGIVCRRCGISRPTLRKWMKRYAENGISGLKDHSRRPLKISNQKIFENQEKLILDLRLNRNEKYSELKLQISLLKDIKYDPKKECIIYPRRSLWIIPTSKN